MDMFLPHISVIINTNGRCLSLMKVVAALEGQRYSNFELCIVVGPTEDGSIEFAQDLAANGRAKVSLCKEMNLSVSRNMGIDLAAGDLIAFLDDDALPEPVWLEQLAATFDEPQIAGAGGLVFQPNGRDIQFRYALCDRFGETTHLEAIDLTPAMHPFRPAFPHVMGANCMFRRDALLEIGGFDEEYEYYLDETDVCCRLIDAGYEIAQADWAPVHHKYLSGATRDGAGLTVRRKSIVKNQLYFSLKNARGGAPLHEIIERALAFTRWHRKDLEGYVRDGKAPASILEEFDRDADVGWEQGLSQGLTSERQTRDEFGKHPAFLPFLQNPNHAAGEHIALIQPFAGAALPPPITCDLNGGVLRSFEMQDASASVAEGPDFVNGIWRHQVSPLAELGGFTTGSRALAAAEVDIALNRALDRVAAFHPFDKIIDLRNGAPQA